MGSPQVVSWISALLLAMAGLLPQSAQNLKSASVLPSVSIALPPDIGLVTEFQLATVSPDANGMFQVELPYFSADAVASTSQQRASFQFRLRDSKTWNHIASNLDPEKQELRLKEHGLRIQPHYPDDLIFTADPFAQLTTMKGRVFRSDSGEAISNSYILLTGENDEAKRFNTRTDEKGEYLFGGIPLEITRCLSTRGFQKGVKFPARILSD